MERNTLVTGSNASGKSTFLKALAVNAILAQTIGVCFAQEFRFGRARVMSSMAVRDSVRGGESYFVAEIRSLKRILDAAEGKTPVLAFVDEILRGTNTIERIAASAAVLDFPDGEEYTRHGRHARYRTDPHTRRLSKHPLPRMGGSGRRDL